VFVTVGLALQTCLSLFNTNMAQQLVRFIDTVVFTSNGISYALLNTFQAEITVNDPQGRTFYRRTMRFAADPSASSDLQRTYDDTCLPEADAKRNEWLRCERKALNSQTKLLAMSFYNMLSAVHLPAHRFTIDIDLYAINNHSDHNIFSVARATHPSIDTTANTALTSTPHPAPFALPPPPPFALPPFNSFGTPFDDDLDGLDDFLNANFGTTPLQPSGRDLTAGLFTSTHGDAAAAPAPAPPPAPPPAPGAKPYITCTATMTNTLSDDGRLRIWNTHDTRIRVNSFYPKDQNKLRKTPVNADFQLRTDGSTCTSCHANAATSWVYVNSPLLCITCDRRSRPSKHTDGDAPTDNKRTRRSLD
jgi:hypothetical protein